ncbi:MAG: hypothetical protein C0404_09565 [Verrucomicrobia bacterium]|nr:hypothetical protein [Verrucomicrobiota bacterium]
MNGKETDILINSYLAGTATDEEIRALDKMIVERPETARELLEQSSIDGHLYALGKLSAKMPVEFDVRKRVPARSAMRWFVGLAATLLLAAGVWWAAQSPSTVPGAAVVGAGAKDKGQTGLSSSGVDAQGTQEATEGIVLAKVEKCSGAWFMAPGRNGTDLMKGDEIRAGDTIETGTNGFVRLAYTGEVVRVEIGKASGFRCQVSEVGGKSLLMDRGSLTAIATKQPEGKPFVVMTPHARADVVGTTFAMLISPKSSELNMISGKIQYTRLSDGKQLVVTDGQSVVAGEGHEFVFRKFKYYQGMEYEDGRILFQDDLVAGIGNWEVLVSTNGRSFRPATEAEISRIVRKLQPDEKWRPTDGRGTMLVTTTNETVALRLKKPLPQAPMSLEFRRVADTASTVDVLYGEVLEDEVVMDFSLGGYEPGGPHKSRHEMIPLETRANAQIIEERFFVWGKPRQVSRTTLARRNEASVTLTFCGGGGKVEKKALFYDVVIREMRKIEGSK